MKISRMPFAGLAAGVLILSVTSGCGNNSAAGAADTNQARSALDRALSAWRDGKTADTLKSEEPPLEASDHQWKNGLHLVKYEVQQHPLPSGSGQTFRVTLWLKDDHSRQTKVITQYDVATTSPIRVARAGF
jgi:hypothetical protein